MNFTKQNAKKSFCISCLVVDDHSRVVLRGDGEASSDYINANFISVSINEVKQTNVIKLCFLSVKDILSICH